LVKNIRSKKNRVLSLVFLKSSDLKEEVPLDVFSEASITILESFILEEIANKDLEKLAAFFMKTVITV